MSSQILRSLSLSAAALAALAVAAPAVAKEAGTPSGKPTVVLVHGAFADSSGWAGVAKELRGKGYPVIAVANPLRSVSGDAQYTASLLKDISGPIVLVGHSYGGSVISNAAVGNDKVKALVYVAAFAPERGETVLGLSGRFPGSTLGGALATPVALAANGVDLYIDQEKFHAQFAADVSADAAQAMAVSQRPVAEAALKESNEGTAWKSIPSYFIYGTGDKNIPPAALAWMAERAKSKKTVVIDGASHVPQISHAHEVATLIDSAATETK
jgi:pimeloyl-ACP methyl ester carboxylesterase